MDICKHCNSDSLRKDGIRNGIQKWRCKSCNRSQSLRDNRVKYSAKERSLALTLYLEGNGFRRIARILSEIFEKFFRWQTIVQWIKRFGHDLETRLEEENKEPKDVEILEMNELYTYIQKKRIESEYGLLLTGTGSVLVRLR